MKILDVSQAMETDAWLEARRGRITGTKSAGLCLEHYALKDAEKFRKQAEKYLAMSEKDENADKRGEYIRKANEYADKFNEAEKSNKRLKVTQDFWNFLAEMLACAPDGEPAAERGHRLENENAMLTLKKMNIDPDTAVFDTKMWVSDIDQRIACSPDCHENSENPTWAIECKSLGSANHLATIIPAMVYHNHYDCDTQKILNDIAKSLFPEIFDYDRDFDLIPDKYKHQVVQYFVVNDNLKTLYFSMYDDRFYTQELAHYVFVIPRETIQTEIVEQLHKEMFTLDTVDILTKTFGDEL